MPIAPAEVAARTARRQSFEAFCQAQELRIRKRLALMSARIAARQGRKDSYRLEVLSRGHCTTHAQGPRRPSLLELEARKEGML
jgi:hypothetical protein